MNPQQLVQEAFSHHQAGRFSEAESIYNQIVSSHPRHGEALHLLGALHHQQGRHDEAIKMVKRALKADRKNLAYSNTLGCALRAAGQAQEAVKVLRKALKQRPNYFEGLNTLGSALRDLGKNREAISTYKKALKVQPDRPEALLNLGRLELEQGRFEDAYNHIQKALPSVGPQPEPLAALAEAQCQLGQKESSIESLCKLLETAPRHPSTRNALSAILPKLRFTHYHPKAVELYQRCLEHPEVDGKDVSGAALQLIKLAPQFIEAINQEVPDIRSLAANPLLLSMLVHGNIADPDIENMLVRLRRQLSLEPDPAWMPVAAILALYFFNGEYVHSQSSQDETIIVALSQRVQLWVENQTIPSENAQYDLILLGMWRPYTDIAGLDYLCQLPVGSLCESIQPVFSRLFLEPQRERKLRESIPAMTEISHQVSLKVRGQYEANPYPRWIRPTLSPERNWKDTLQGACPNLKLPRNFPDSPRVLVAGCGTGRHPINLALSHPFSQIDAIDLSLSSLAYAERKRAELGIANLSFGHADILKLEESQLKPGYEIIESVGVLHHLEEPEKGFEQLIKVSAPRAVFKIGLYSKIARKVITEARKIIAEEGIEATPENIRQLRADIFEGDRYPQLQQLRYWGDMYTMSDARDLLFHVQEHQYDLPELKETLAKLNLRFLGFVHHDLSLLDKFRAEHPDPKAWTNLDTWAQFEVENPHAFRCMYQFYCQKAG